VEETKAPVGVRWREIPAWPVLPVHPEGLESLEHPEQQARLVPRMEQPQAMPSLGTVKRATQAIRRRQPEVSW